MTANELRTLTEAYLARYPEERTGLQALLLQYDQAPRITSRKTFPGHVTASAIVISPDRKRVLLIYHKVFNGWFQPGGHSEAHDQTPWATAEREAVEETAVEIAERLIIFADEPDTPLRIDTHPVPARPDKQEPAHSHHDFQYVFIAASEQLTHQVSEVNDAAWFDLDAPECSHIADSIQRLRWLSVITN